MMRLTKGFVFLCLMVLQLMGASSFALPFSVVPNGPLPTQLLPGETAPASYIVTNNTGTTRSGNFVKYLPPNVTQDTTEGAGVCGATFTLTARGTPNDHCMLNLLVSGPVNANDQNPHHHLFVCFPGGATCAGTNSPLNVMQSSILYGVTGESGATQHTLFTLDPLTGFATQIMTLTQSTCCGHIISSDGSSLYHWNGHNNVNQVFEKIDLDNLTLMPIPLTGFGIGEPNGAVFFNGKFLYSDYEEQFSTVTTGGFATQIGNTDGRVRGMACFNHHIYGVDPFSPSVFEIDPANGSPLSTNTITLPGFTVEGATGLTVDPIGTFYALIKVSSSNIRKLAIIDVNTGACTEIGDADNGSGLRFSSIAFNPTNPGC